MKTKAKTGFKGVCNPDPSGRYRARIRFKGERIDLGFFDTALEAAEAYDLASEDLYGPDARTNKRKGLLHGAF